MEAEGGEWKGDAEEAGQQATEEEPAEARTGEYHWYDTVLYMSEVGDMDEAGKFCISGRNITEEGPRTRSELDDVIRDAIVRGGGDVWKVPDFMVVYTDANIRKPMYKRIEAPADGFLKIVPSTGCSFYNYEFYNGVEIDINYRFGQRNELEPYEKDVSTALNRVLRHHAGKVMDRVHLGLKYDDAGWVPIDDLLKYENVWKQDSSRSPHVSLAPRGKSDDKRAWDKQEAGYRMSVLFMVMFHCARYGQRVREQILAFGIYPDIDRNSETCRANGVDRKTKIPEEGLLVYAVAVRAPTGHKLSLVNDVTLRASLLSHPIAPNTVILLPVCFHITMKDRLKSIWKEGLIPGGLDGNTRIFTFCNPYVPWDQRSWTVTKSVDTRLGGYVCLYIPTETLMRDFGGRLTDSGQVVTDQIVPFSKIRGGWIQDANCRWHRLIVPSGEEQVVRTGSVKSRKVATKESVIRIAQQCVKTMDVMTILSRFEKRQIIEGGKEQYEAQ